MRNVILITGYKDMIEIGQLLNSVLEQQSTDYWKCMCGDTISWRGGFKADYNNPERAADQFQKLQHHYNQLRGRRCVHVILQFEVNDGDLREVTSIANGISYFLTTEFQHVYQIQYCYGRYQVHMALNNVSFINGRKVSHTEIRDVIFRALNNVGQFGWGYQHKIGSRRKDEK